MSVGTVQHYFDTRDRLIAELFDWSATRRLAAWLYLAVPLLVAGGVWTAVPVRIGIVPVGRSRRRPCGVDSTAADTPRLLACVGSRR